MSEFDQYPLAIAYGWTQARRHKGGILYLYPPMRYMNARERIDVADLGAYSNGVLGHVHQYFRLGHKLSGKRGSRVQARKEIAMNVKAKMVVESVIPVGDGSAVRLGCRYDETLPEDQRFFDATPSGSCEMVVNNPAALEQFALGKAFYVTFAPAAE